MKILIKNPPNIEYIRKFLTPPKGVIFTYGDTIYNPDNGEVTGDIMDHEAVHSLQQVKLGPEKWWDKYLNDKEFRFEQELQAYQVQYRHATQIIKDPNQQNRFLMKLASHLSSAAYGNLVGFDEARRMIQYDNLNYNSKKSP
jgi:hypothetical protein